ncbi:hypothetical protein ACN4EK_31725 [Pantanalinema rosaneae CENA516]|uniref:hypothetical protein n=1 Tax=Pantanalinema rosaneae TaxID=1620701 RepID=UPI003D6E7246
MLKSFYRRQPVVSFVVTAGAVDAAIGGLTSHWSLFLLGLGTVGGAIGVSLWQWQTRKPLEVPDHPPVYVLPPQSSRPSLPMLSMTKKQPPR